MLLYIISIDYPNIFVLNWDMYKDNFKKITKEDLKPNFIAACLSYITMAISINYFILNKFNNSHLPKI